MSAFDKEMIDDMEQQSDDHVTCLDCGGTWTNDEIGIDALWSHACQ